MEIERIEIPEEVINTKSNERFTVISITIVDNKENGHTIDLNNFMDSFIEYIDPKDLKIQMLEEEIRKLKEKHKPVRKKKRTLLPGEVKEIKELLFKGESNIDIAKEYDVSDSTVSRIRVELKKEGKL